MLFTILYAVAGLLILLAIVIALQPPKFVVRRSAVIDAPPAVVFAQVNDFRKWDDWSPWAKLDPMATNEFLGEPSGAGAEFHWAGNNKVGEGHMTITDSRPDEAIRIKLDFIRPFKSTNTTDFTFAAQPGPRGEQTAVTWAMSGDKNFLTKAFGLFCNMDKMVGRDFEKGLASMKAIAEREAGRA